MRGFDAVPKLALLANPDSGGGDAWDAAQALRSLGAEVRSFSLADRDRALEAGIERVVVAGGDGSVGCAADVAARARVPLAVIPVGTANDFARALEIPLDPDESCELAVRGTTTRAIDLARFGSRPFVNAASAGLSPVAARSAHGLKRVLGPLAYAVGALRAGLRAAPVACRVRCDGTELFAGRAWQVTVASTGAFGGGAEVEADPHDGLLDTVVIEAGSRLSLIRRAHGLRAGRVESQPGVHTAGGRVIEVDTDGSTGFNVDGELVEAERVSITVEARAFEVVVS